MHARDADKHDEPIDEYMKCEIEDQEDLRVICRNAIGLVQLDKPKTLIVSFNLIKDGEKYHVYR
jgi:hypothetical protein